MLAGSSEIINSVGQLTQSFGSTTVLIDIYSVTSAGSSARISSFMFLTILFGARIAHSCS